MARNEYQGKEETDKFDFGKKCGRTEDNFQR
jgi:hypothetical protein